MGWLSRRSTKDSGSGSGPRWPRSLRVAAFGPGDEWTLADAFEGLQVFGASGSGKTSGSGELIATNLLKTGMGGLVLAAKPDEPGLWKRYAQAAGREQDIVLFPDPKAPQCFDFLTYETAKNPHATSRDLASLFVIAARIGRPRQTYTNADYWEGAMKRLVQESLELLMIAGQVSVGNLRRVAEKVAYMDPDEWAAFRDEMLESKVIDEGVEAVLHYFEKRLPRVPARQREGFVDPFFTLVDIFESGILAQVFACGKADGAVDPLRCLTDQKVIVMCLPATLNPSDGRVVQVLYKIVWQRAMMRRPVEGPEDQRPPAFLWADESQMFAIPSDTDFQQFARSNRIATVYLTQNLSNYARYLSTEETRSLLGNLQTKIFHANGDTETNRYAVESIGELRGPEFRVEHDAEQGHILRLRSSIDHRQVDSALFTMLRKGGPGNDGEVDAVVFQAGRTWSNGKNWMRVTFRQSGVDGGGGQR